MELFKLDPGLAIWTWISFGILFFILWKFAFPALIGNIKERENLIAKSVDNADEIQKRLNDINTEYAGIIKKAKSEADSILLETRKESDILKKKLLLKAEQEAADIVKNTKDKMLEERESVLLSLQNEIAVFACDVSEKIVDSSFTSDKDREWAMELAKSL